MPKYLLDSSAVLAVLFREQGFNEVASCLNQAFISSVNYCEVISKVVSKNASPEESKFQIESIIENIIPFEKDLALKAGTLTSFTKQFGLSLGDRACIATALHYGYEIITSDRVWQQLSLPVKINVFR